MIALAQFGGLNLKNDPEEIGFKGSIDLLNVDLDKWGRIRSRDGYDNLTASAATIRLQDIAPFYTTSGARQVLTATSDGSFNSFYRAYTTAGATIADQSLAGSNMFEADFTRFGGPGAEVSYASSWRFAYTQAHAVYKWNGTIWAATTVVQNGADPYMLEVKADDNRLVGAFTNDQFSRVGFSNPGVPETWTNADYVSLTPGDGERIMALVAWREKVFAFKETKFFVFGTTSTSDTGTPVFNYRPVSSGVGTVARRCAVATPLGVYFLSRRGIYKTTGDDPILISRDVDPIFRGGASSIFTGGVLNHAAINKCQLAWHDERLYFAYPSGSSTSNDRLLVFDPETENWILWNIGVNGLTSFRVGDFTEMIFTYASGSNHIGRISSSFTTDDGTSIASHYQTGWSEVEGRAQRLNEDSFVRGLALRGTGDVTTSVFTDYATSDADSTTVSLGSTFSRGLQQKSRQGKIFGLKVSGTSPWQLTGVKIGQYP